MFQQYLARQLGKPSGFFGKFVLGPLWNKRNEKLNDVTLDKLELTQDDRVLDIGFGGGYLLKKIVPEIVSGFVAGIDISPVIVANCRSQFSAAIDTGKIDIRCGSVEALTFPDRYFTKVCSVNSIFYWNDAQLGLEEICRCLRENGKIVITFTSKKDIGHKGFAKYGLKPFEPDEMRKMFQTAGFGKIEIYTDHDRNREFFCIVGFK
jgi:SAM-dependent methyltransferase